MSIELTRVGDRIHLRSPYDPDIARMCKSLSGGFLPKTKTWTFPLSTDMCRLLRASFPKLQIARPLWEWASEAMEKEKSQSALGSSVDSGGAVLKLLPRSAPGLAKRIAARPYQVSGASFIANGRNAIVADRQGLGKTTMTIAGIVESGVPGPYLIVAPQTSLDSVWEREIKTCLPGARVAVAGLGGRSRAQRSDTLFRALCIDERHDSNTWVIVNIEMIRTKGWWVCEHAEKRGGPIVCGERWVASDKPKSSVVDCGHDPKKVKVVNDHEYPALFGVEWGAIVMDECQRSLIRTSGTPTQTRRGAKLLQTRPDGLRLALSGTPMRGKPHRLWGTMNWIDPVAYSGFWGWLERFFEVTETGYAGARSIGPLRKDREGILFQSLSGIMLRRTKEEVSPDLPPKSYMDNRTPEEREFLSPAIWLKMDPKQGKAYQQMLQDGSADVEGGRLNTIGILAEMTRLKQLANCYAELGSIHHPARKATKKELSSRNYVEIDYFGEWPFWNLPQIVDGMMPAWDEDAVLPALPSNKFDWVTQFLKDASILDGDEPPAGKVVIVSQFTRHLDMMEVELKKAGVKTLSITGKVTGANRTRAQDLFNDPNSGHDVLLLNTIAGGVAITLDAADDMIFLDETFVPDDQDQAEDRINNRRPEERVAVRRYWYLKSLGTIDEAIARANIEADANQRRILDDRRGVPFLRSVMEQLKEMK